MSDLEYDGVVYKHIGIYKRDGLVSFICLEHSSKIKIFLIK